MLMNNAPFALRRGLLFGGIVTSAVAEPATNDPPLSVELDAIEVTAGVPVRGDPMLQAASVDVLTGEELRRRQRFTIGETLEALPGVSSISAGTQVGKPVIRGLTGNQIQAL
jgi:iron complex outermembrane receptor protein/hemoglobin/transferrin/lactoferrin receptor protein